jgi:hypothetical protein
MASLFKISRLEEQKLHNYSNALVIFRKRKKSSTRPYRVKSCPAFRLLIFFSYSNIVEPEPESKISTFFGGAGIRGKAQYNNGSGSDFVFSLVFYCYCIYYRSYTMESSCFRAVFWSRVISVYLYGKLSDTDQS